MESSFLRRHQRPTPSSAVGMIYLLSLCYSRCLHCEVNLHLLWEIHREYHRQLVLQADASTYLNLMPLVVRSIPDLLFDPQDLV